MNHFFSIQYAAIQKTVFRHDRLWSMAGTSAALSALNESTLGTIAEAHGGRVLVAGGGKFTVEFDDASKARKARAEAIRAIATRFPMLEHQVSDIVGADCLVAPDGQTAAALQPLMDDLKSRKREFRGYGVTFNPHLLLCGECGDYPGEHARRADKVTLCRICDMAKRRAKISLTDIERAHPPTLTTIEKIYGRYLKGAASATGKTVPHNFEDLFHKNTKASDEEPAERRRMAVWLSDINGMKNKINIWIREPDILGTFQKVKDVFIEAVAAALIGTFPTPEGVYLPFRLIIAGGDDLCLVMAEEHILDFALNLSEKTTECLRHLDQDPDHPLNPHWLAGRKRELDMDKPLGPYSFGGAFVIGSVHTPFRRIHEAGEKLMTAAKRETDRQGNSVNWRIMAEAVSQTDHLLPFEKPIFVDGNHEKADWYRLNLTDYLKMRKKYDRISGSHRFQIISKMIELREAPVQFERWLKAHAASDTDKDFSGILTEDRLRKEGRLAMDRLATLFELMGIKGGVTDGTEG